MRKKKSTQNAWRERPLVKAREALRESRTLNHSKRPSLDPSLKVLVPNALIQASSSSLERQ